MNDIQIRRATEADFASLFAIFEAVLASGDTYPFPAGTARDACHAYWLGPGVDSFVALHGGDRVVAMYRIVPNQPGRGSHVANASFMVSPSAQGIGIGKLLGEHCIAQATRLGYLAMQFNIVVSTNTRAVRLWQKLGFEMVATLPKVYRHASLGYVDAYVMYRFLVAPDSWPA